MVSSNSLNTPRIFTRGEQGQFKVGFFLDPNQTTPLVPIDPSYPQYTIFNPQGTSIQAGVGVQATPGNWVTNWQVPKDAELSYFQQTPQQFGNVNEGQPLSYNQARYRIEWTMVTAENYQVSFVEEFDIRDIAITQAANRELKYLSLAGDPVRLLYRTTVLPYKASMRLVIRGNLDNPVASAFYDSSLPAGNQGTLNWAIDGDSYVMYYDLESGVTCRNTAYLALWTIQDTQFSVPTTEFQVLVSVSVNALPLLTSLRMLIDKFQKRLGRVQAFEDSDLLEYISQGVRMVNLNYPTTSWPLDAIPDDMQTLVLLAAGWYGLQAQSLLENDLQFNFSGQSVTLSVDRQAGLDSAASKMMEMFNSQIGPAKMAYVRRAGGTGTVAGRAYNYRHLYNYVYQVSSTNNFQLLSALTKIGLL